LDKKENSRDGEYTLLSIKGDIAVVKFSSCNQPSQVYALFFKEADTLE
jgi:hypothetical protein